MGRESAGSLGSIMKCTAAALISLWGEHCMIAPLLPCPASKAPPVIPPASSTAHLAKVLHRGGGHGAGELRRRRCIQRHQPLRAAVLQAEVAGAARQHLQRHSLAVHLCMHQLRAAAARVPHQQDAMRQLHLQRLAGARGGGSRQLGSCWSYGGGHLLPLQCQHHLQLALKCVGGTEVRR